LYVCIPDAPTAQDAQDPRANSNLDTGPATVDNTRDEILDELLKDERRVKEIIEWFQQNKRIDVSTLDLPELEKLFAEQGPGTTLTDDHDPYPNVCFSATCVQIR
jgi:hypothetical protein